MLKCENCFKRYSLTCVASSMGRVDLGNLDPSAHLLSLSESLV